MQQLRQRSLSRLILAALALLPFPALHSVLEPPRFRRRFVRLAQIVGATLAVALPAACEKAHAESTSSVRTASANPYLAFVNEAAQRFNIRTSWIRGVMHMESGDDPRAVSAKGAMGLMQLMPATWAYLRSRYKLGADPFDPHDNIVGGTAYLRELYDRFGASGFLAAYNAGPEHFQDYLAGLRPLPDETKRYVTMLGHMLPDLPVDGSLLPGANVSELQRAALFIATPTSSLPNVIILPGHVAVATSTSPMSALAPQSNGLFVSVQTTGQR
jgi:hypothetical protein